ncbi:MAG: hypothetical protein WAN60_04930 [Candidatus Sulfotelmatobacter sp.]
MPDVQAGVASYARDFLPGIPVANMGLCRIDLENIRLNYVPDFIANVPDFGGGVSEDNRRMEALGARREGYVIGVAGVHTSELARNLLQL